MLVVKKLLSFALILFSLFMLVGCSSQAPQPPSLHDIEISQVNSITLQKFKVKRVPDKKGYWIPQGLEQYGGEFEVIDAAAVLNYLKAENELLILVGADNTKYFEKGGIDKNGLSFGDLFYRIRIYKENETLDFYAIEDTMAFTLEHSIDYEFYDDARQAAIEQTFGEMIESGNYKLLPNYNGNNLAVEGTVYNGEVGFVFPFRIGDYAEKDVEALEDVRYVIERKVLSSDIIGHYVGEGGENLGAAINTLYEITLHDLVTGKSASYEEYNHGVHDWGNISDLLEQLEQE